jgi:tetratricopeptide (TPR) repeat protein
MLDDGPAVAGPASSEERSMTPRQDADGRPPRSRPAPGRLVLVAATVCGASACGSPSEVAREPRKIVVQGANTGTLDAVTTAGLVREITHWLEYDPALIVRGPSRRLRPVTDPVGGDIDDVLWVEVDDGGEGAAIRWEVVEADAGRPPTFTEADPILGALPRLPGAVAAAVAAELGLAAVGSGDADGHANKHAARHTAGDGVAHTAADPSAYADFLRILGAPPTADDERDAIRARIDLLEELRPSLMEYAPAAYALGSAYLDLAGLVGGTGPWYGLAEAELVRAFELDPGDPPVRAKLASYFSKLGRSEEAVDLLVEGLGTHPWFPDFHQTLGYVLRYAGLMAPSMESYRRSQELDASPGNLISAQDQITKSLIYLGDYDAALDSHRRMLAFAEADGRDVDEKQWFYEGVIHLYRGDTEAAVNAFRTGARVDPTTVWTTFGRAYEAMALGDTVAVGVVLDELEKRDVVDGERHYRLVHFAAFLGDVDRAVDHLRQSTEGGFFNAPYLATDPWTEVLRGQPEVEAMIETARRRGQVIESKLVHGQE